MNQVNARHEIIREWRWLPKEQRQTDEQAEASRVSVGLITCTGGSYRPFLHDCNFSAA